MADVSAQAAAAKQEGNAHYKARRFPEAVEAYTRAIDLEPTKPVYYTNRAAVYFMQQDWDRAQQDCENAIKAGAENPVPGNQKFVHKAYVRLGDIALKRNPEAFQEAIDLYNKALVEDHVPQTRRKVRDFQDQLAVLQKKQYIDPEIALEHKAKGNAFFSQQNWVKALEEYTESLKRNPEDHKVYSNRAACYTKLMAWREALDDCETCLGIDPMFLKAYVRKGRVEHMLKQYHRAIKTYNLALKLPGAQEASELVEARALTWRTVMMENSTGNVDPERRQRAMEDPDVVALLRDPIMSQLLESKDPKRLSEAMQDDNMRESIEFLIAAGVLALGG